MITVKCSEERFTYSAYHLVKAFFPDEEVHTEVMTAQDTDGDLSYSGVQIYGDEGLLAGVPYDGDRKAMDRAVYDLLAEKTGTDLPWGILTGVRPSKLAMEQIRSIYSGTKDVGWEAEKNRFTWEIAASFRVSPAKAALIWNIARKEIRCIDTAFHQAAGKDTFSLYAGIPVCPSICSYCSFSSGPFSVWGSRLDDYIDALCSELKAASERTGAMHLTSIYIGGGTPTVLNESQLERLLKCINDCYLNRADHVPEFTLEAGRPDTINRQKLEIARAYGVNRISINPQTMQQRTLDLVGREHTVQDVADKYYLAREAGFDNINMDLIAGLPGETPEDMRDSLQRVAELVPDSLTVHALAVKRAARLEHQYASGREAKVMIEYAAQAAADMGLEPYYLYRQKSIAGNLENVGYARNGKECIYNIMIIEEAQSIIACGAGASTKIRLKEPIPNPDRRGKVMTSILHSDNPRSIDQYITEFKIRY